LFFSQKFPDYSQSIAASNQLSLFIDCPFFIKILMALEITVSTD